MGVCFSAIRVTGTSSSSRRSSNNNPNRKGGGGCNNNNNKKKPKSKTPPEKNDNKPTNTKRRTTTGSSISCGKRTDFGYAKDFHEQYSIGKLLGHGQFGYTYVAIHNSNGDRVAVKKLDKTKVLFRDCFFLEKWN